MSSIKISSIESQCNSSSLFPIISKIEQNSSQILSTNTEKFHLKTPEQQIKFEIKTDNYSRNIEIKTKQEDSICTTNKSTPIITCLSTNQSSSPKCIRIHQSPQSSTSNSSIQNVRICVSPSPHKNIHFQLPTISNLVQKNLNENIKSNKEEEEKEKEQRFNRRPLFDLLNQINQSENLEKSNRILSPSPTRILPAKQFPPFQPVILHKKYQEPIGHFELINNKEDSSSNNQNNILLKNSSINNEESSSTTPNLTPTTPQNLDDKDEAKRKAIALQMYDTENSYVEALKNLVTKYYLPMKDKDIVSNDLINDIFYKIPEIHIHHTAFLISLSQKLSEWDNKQTVGDVLLQMFSRTSVIETYTSFVNNYKTAQIAIRLCREYSSFNKFLEQQARDHRGKLTLRDLIIQPVQRIPRYELYIKDFLKCTFLNHPDYQLLLKAQSEIHSLAQQIDHVQKEVKTTEFNFSNNSLELVQDIIQNLNDLVNSNRYYIRHDVVTLQSSSGLKKDRCIFLFNDLIIITSWKRNSTKKSNNSIIVNSPSGKQYINNAKHKLIMKISLDNVDITTDHFKKRRSSSASKTSTNLQDKHKNFEEDILTLVQMSNLAKTITVPHQQLDDSIKETVNIVNKQLNNETISISESNNIQLIINTNERIEILDVLFSSLETKITWQKNFLQAKKILFENSVEQKNVIFDHIFTLPQNRPGSELTCITNNLNSNDFYICNTEGEINLININENIEFKYLNKITKSKINLIEYIPSINKNNYTNINKNIIKNKNIDSLFEIDSSDEEYEQDFISINSLENNFNNQQDTLWIATQNGELIIYQYSQINKIFSKKNRIIKQLNYSIHSILYNNNKVYIGLNNRQICIFNRDKNGYWDYDNPLIELIKDNSIKSNEENSPPITLLTFINEKIWCAIKDKIFIISPDSLNIEYSFLVDDYHRHILSIATDNSSSNYVWIASQDSHQIHLYHSINYVCLFDFSIKPTITQKLQMIDDIIRVHKLGCLHISTLYVYKEILWIGTSAGIILYLKISQLIDSLTKNKLTLNSIQLESLSYGHAGPIKFIISNKNHLNSFIISIGYGLEDFNQNQQHFGKDDTFYHLILWKLHC